MKSIRLVRLLLMGLVVLLILVPAGAVWAVPPDRATYHAEFDVPWIECPGFTVYEKGAIDLRVRQHYDQDGNWVRAVEHYNWDGIVYNSEHPEIFLEENTTHFKITYDPDGLETWVGLAISIFLPGEGQVLFGAGRVQLYWVDGQPIFTFFAGQSDWMEGDTGRLCAALAAE